MNEIFRRIVGARGNENAAHIPMLRGLYTIYECFMKITTRKYTMEAMSVI